MALPAVALLKERRKDLFLSVATPAKLSALWEICPFVDEIITLVKPKNFLSTIAVLRRKKFGVSILFPNSFRVAAEAKLAGIPLIVGYRGNGRSPLLSHPVKRKPFNPLRQHQQYDYLDLISDELRSDVFFPALQKPAVERKENRVALFPGAEYGPAKRWPAPYFAEIAKKFRAEKNVEVVLFGASGDLSVAKEIASMAPEVEVRVGKTSLQELITELASTRFVLSNDSGAMHLAAALGVPTVALFGSTEPRRTGPLGKTVRVLRHHVPCSPCFLRNCPIDFACMHALTPQMVWNACLDLWNETETLIAS